MPLSPEDVIAAGADFVALSLGGNVPHPHPAARDLSLRELAAAVARRANPYQQDPRAAAGTGMRMREFGRIIAEGARSYLVGKFLAQAQHRRFCGFVEVKTFHRQEVTSLDSDVELKQVGDAGEVTLGGTILNGTGATAQIVSYARNLVISREAILSTDLDALSSTLAAVGLSAARLEARLVVRALQANPVMGDGIPLFHADHGNEVGGEFVSAFDSALQALRTQSLSGGHPADLEAAHLVVSAKDEFAAKKLVHETGQSDGVTVTAMAGIPAGTGYLLANQEIAPTVAVVVFPGQPNRVSVAAEPVDLGID